MGLFIAGFFIGTFIGIAIMCMLQVAGEADKREFKKGENK